MPGKPRKISEKMFVKNVRTPIERPSAIGNANVEISVVQDGREPCRRLLSAQVVTLKLQSGCRLEPNDKIE